MYWKMGKSFVIIYETVLKSIVCCVEYGEFYGIFVIDVKSETMISEKFPINLKVLFLSLSSVFFV